MVCIVLIWFLLTVLQESSNLDAIFIVCRKIKNKISKLVFAPTRPPPFWSKANFLIFFNPSLIFADDTTLQMSNQDAKTLFEKVNSALASASDWFRANKLTLHPSKTKLKKFSAGQHTELESEIL